MICSETPSKAKKKALRRAQRGQLLAGAVCVIAPLASREANRELWVEGIKTTRSQWSCLRRIECPSLTAPIVALLSQEVPVSCFVGVSGPSGSS